MTMSRLLIFIAVLLTSIAPARAQTTRAATVPALGKTMQDLIGPAPRNGGFAMDGYFIWCSSVIKVGDTYQMFASRWPVTEKGIGAWTSLSECVRATSKDLLGPYKFEEVVLQKRLDSWDNTRVHNVKIVQAGGKLVLYYINSANETGYAVADAVTGPWKRLDKPVMKLSNPAILVRPDESIYVFGRLRVGQTNRGIAFTAPTYQGPYTLLEEGGNLLPNDCELEDPTIWWANDQYNVLMNDWKGKATGIFKAGVQYFSKDGIHYQLMSPEPVFTREVKFDDGTSQTFRRRERPFVYANEKGEVLALFTACMMEDESKGSRVVAQPVDHYVPSNTLGR
jgi:hypothetical protein